MYGALLTIHIIASLFLIFVILIQQKGGGLGSMFGGGQSVFGGRGANPFLTKTTVVLFTVFIATSFSLVFMTKGRVVRKESAIEKAVKKGEFAPPPIPYEGE